MGLEQEQHRQLQRPLVILPVHDHSDKVPNGGPMVGDETIGLLPDASSPM
jgi:hypothetical protein